MRSDNEVKKRKNYNSPLAYMTIVAGILLNYLGSKAAASSGLPVYLDNIGTIAAAVLGGYLPGIITAVINNIINYALDSVSIYYASISAMIAVAAAYIYRGEQRINILRGVKLTLVAAFIGGILGGIITWFLSGTSTDGTAGDLLNWCTNSLGLGPFYAHELSTFILDLADKAVTVVIALIIIRLVPDRYRSKLWLSGWRQAPLEDESVSSGTKLKEINVDNRSLNNRITLMLIFASLSMAVIVTGVSSSLFRQYTREEHLSTASGIAKLAASVVDPEMVDEYLAKGDSAEGYAETEKRLMNIRESSPDIEYVYVYQILEDGCHVVFDLDTADLKGEEPGTVIPFDESFEKNIPALLAGEPIEPIETNDTYGWLLTAYEPVYDSSGKCVCYAAADVKFQDIQDYEKDFAIKVVLLFLGFFILILVIGLWLSRYNIILPIKSMTYVARASRAGIGHFHLARPLLHVAQQIFKRVVRRILADDDDLRLPRDRHAVHHPRQPLQRDARGGGHLGHGGHGALCGLHPATESSDRQDAERSHHEPCRHGRGKRLGYGQPRQKDGRLLQDNP